MADEPQTEPVKQKTPLLFPSRIILLALLAVAIGGLVVDQLAKRSAQAAFDAVDAAMGKEGTLNDVSRDEVRKLIGREPSDDSDPEDLCETYSWQGGLKQHKVFVQYRPGKEGLLKDVSLNEPPAGFVE